jgi:peptidyl-prolyl cis-trans isomerase SurA
LFRPAVLAIALAASFAHAAAAQSSPAGVPATAAPAAVAPSAHPSPINLPQSEGSTIVAVVNGDVITQGDVDNRRRLFALSTGMPVASDVLTHLTPQITQELIDERLRLQEIQRRGVVVSDRDIAAALDEVEHRNGMQPGVLRKRLESVGIAWRTMIDQMRVQIGWSRVLHDVLGSQARIGEADIKQRQDLLQTQIGQTEYRVSEIFVPSPDPAQAEQARSFADTIIQQLRAGAPFPIVAAQFSQSQTALQGGDLGWVQASQLDPAVLRVVDAMPPGAISNPIPVPGGLSIDSLLAKRQIGQQPATIVHLRQVFYRFVGKFENDNPTEQQRAQVELARRLGANTKTCEAMEAAAHAAGDEKGGDPGEVRLEAVTVPALRQIMGTLPIGQASAPLIADDGVAVLMVCSRDQRNLGLPNADEITSQLINQRADLASRQLMRELQRRALIDRRA